ncbi:competence type IV pilus minor pilin ComGD [Bacillus sp. FJAT-42315]|uniref:competence type IV pilus minor pilin ComGD n=1 Tax=Bacillus sp. FJAT-42315 TaxID=2014077 RepID=UPI000C244621|nr:competence type IV pilus minor pilin ComGD [Bacillus sp. FJAT-42315]
MLIKRMEHIRNQQGVSMLEMLIVLSVFLIILSAAMIPFPKMLDNMEKEKFMDQLQADLYLAQSYAISKQEIVNIQFLMTIDSYRIKTVNVPSEMLAQRELPDSIQHMEGSLQEIWFLPNGHTNRFGTMLFKYKDRYIKVVFQIGKGRFYVEEQ